LRTIVNTEDGADVSTIDRAHAAEAATPKEVPMKLRSIVLSIGVAAAIAAPAVLAAQGPAGGGPGFGHGHHGGQIGGPDGDGPGFLEHLLPRLAERLELNDEQVAAIEAILDESRPEIEGYAAELRAGREAYREAHSDPTVFDESSFRAHAAEQSRVQTELMVAAQRTKARVLALLSPEQLAELGEMRGAAGARFMRRPGGRHSS
jgi:Spy/CpxP family protein refolding chaperone